MCFGFTVSGNAKTLLISTFLFLAITSGQYFAGEGRCGVGRKQKSRGRHFEIYISHAKVSSVVPMSTPAKLRSNTQHLSASSGRRFAPHFAPPFCSHRRLLHHSEGRLHIHARRRAVLHCQPLRRVHAKPSNQEEDGAHDEHGQPGPPHLLHHRLPPRGRRQHKLHADHLRVRRGQR